MTTHATTTDPSLVHGDVVELRDGILVLALPGTDYRLHLLADPALKVEPKQRITGKVTAEAMRVDIAQSGGRFIEPVYGRPRRVQGRVVAIDPQNNTITVKAACPVVVTLTADQRAEKLPLGAIATFDVRRGAAFTLTP